MVIAFRRLFIVLALYSTGSGAQSPTPATTPFDGKLLAAPHIYVESPAQFVKWNGKPIPQSDHDPQYFERTRIGTVTLGTDLKVYVDVIQNLVHFPSHYELIDTRSGAVLGRYDVFDSKDADWYFSGNGTAYLNQTHLSLCGPRHTRKISQKGKKLFEVTQPLVYVGAETDVEEPTQLYESPTSSKVVATVLPGSKVTVLGLLPEKSDFFESAYLVKTPFGLTGWHIPRDTVNDGRLSIYQCN